MTIDHALIQARLDDLTARRAAIPPLGNRSLSMTRAESDALDAEAARLDRQLAEVHAAASTCAALGSAEADEKWLDFLTAARATLSAELLAFKSPIRDPKKLGLQQNVRLSIRCIDRGSGVLEGTGYELTNTRLGELMREAGYAVMNADPSRNYAGVMPWFGSMLATEERLGALGEQRAKAAAALAEALLTDDERSGREAEARQHRDALNGLYIKVSGDGTRLVAYKTRQAFRDDEPYELSDMTEVERRAFERMDAAHRAPLAPSTVNQ
jgi:hypothetical protein